MTCKENCLYYEACYEWGNILDPIHGGVPCDSFKDKNLFVELPCKIGDKMYKLCSVNSLIKMGQMWDGKIVERNCDRCGYRNCSCYDIGLRELDAPHFIHVVEERIINSLEFLIKIKPYVGTVWFSTQEAAEQALKKRVNKIV